MKKKLILLSTAALLVAIAIVGGSLAATSAVGQKATNDLASPTLAVSIDSSAAAELFLDSTSAMPGDELAASFTIENTADVPLYARVTVPSGFRRRTSSPAPAVRPKYSTMLCRFSPARPPIWT